ncbi:hypothetical protein AV530_019942 [Patagioenas fasciata monilis]|uniref:Uncharacterized protein n=1 Tax=Patagioenas fasciata monilis TaxID=372326 RepID=A0A1V4JR33_PATFA|nr:hypothetical protein AV530_019942 [Patagioenas fasciata monilis]
MCCAYRNKYMSQGTSSWKLFAHKPEPQEVPFTSDSRAAQVRRARGTAQGSSQQKWVPLSQAVVCTQTSHVNFLFSVRRLNTVLENNLTAVKKT